MGENEIEQLIEMTRPLSAKAVESAKVILLYSGSLQPDGHGSFKDGGLRAWQVATKIAEIYP